MEKDKYRDLFPGALEMMILRALKRQPLHGQALVRHIKRTSNDLLPIEVGSLYSARKDLLEQGCEC
jgi:PadR family transcriptional regulator PadR